MTRLRAALAALALALCAASAEAQPRVEIADVGPGQAGRVLAQVLRRPHRLAGPDTAPLIITREVEVRGALVVLGRSVRIDGTVDGDVVVVDGDLYIRAGAHVKGRAIAIGGGAYPSAMAIVEGETQTYRDGTYHIERVGDGYRLSYQSTQAPEPPPLLFPELYGVRSPTYDRVNGLSVPFGPAFSFAREHGVVDVLATWRSDLGLVDPSVKARLQLTRRSRLALDARRGSFSNDAWIWQDLVHSFFAFTFGEDNRNWFRSDRLEVMAHRLMEGSQLMWEPFVGVRWERAYSVTSAVNPRTGPWHLFGQADSIGMRRPNPPINDGHGASFLLGTVLTWENDALRVNAKTATETALPPTGPAFLQATTDVGVGFPTFGEQSYGMDVHWVMTVGETPPPQRYVYLGGSGTMPFLDMLSQGGDQLLLIDQRYSIPLTRLNWGAFGSPVLQLRHRIGSAGVGSLPTFEQMLGVGLSLTVIRGEVQFDPSSQRVRATAGFTFSR